MYGGSIYLGYVYICQQVILFWCSGAMYTWGQLVRGRGLCTLVTWYYCLGVVGLCTLGVNKWEGPPHFSIGYTGLV